MKAKEVLDFLDPVDEGRVIKNIAPKLEKIKMWMVILPVKNSQFIDVVFETNLEGLILQILGGLAGSAIYGIYDNKTKAEDAGRLLMAKSDRYDMKGNII